MRLFLIYLKRYRFIIAGIDAAAIFLLVALNCFRRVITDYDISNVILIIEIFTSFFIAMAISTIFSNKYELELAKINGNKFRKLFFMVYLIFIVFAFIPTLAAGLAILPQWIHLKFLFSCFVTTVFITGAALMINIVVNNVYANLCSISFLFFILFLNHKTTQNHLFDIYINENAHVVSYTGSAVDEIKESLWITNREIFLVVGIVFLITAAILSDRILGFNQKNFN